MPVQLDFADQPHRQLVRGYGALRLDLFAMQLLVTVQQTRFEHDRGDCLDLALAVENYMTRQRRVVTRQDNSTGMAVFGLPEAQRDDTAADDVLKNGSLFRIFTEPWVGAGGIKGTPQLTSAISFRLPDWEVAVFKSS